MEDQVLFVHRFQRLLKGCKVVQKSESSIKTKILSSPGNFESALKRVRKCLEILIFRESKIRDFMVLKKKNSPGFKKFKFAGIPDKSGDFP